jgi:hypothetical protein
MSGSERNFVTTATDIEPIRVRRLGGGRFYRSKLNLIAGEPGVGTTNLVLSLAASVSVGRGWPSGDDSACEGDVIYISTEGDAAAVQSNLLLFLISRCGCLCNHGAGHERVRTTSYNCGRILKLMLAPRKQSCRALCCCCAMMDIEK